MQYRIRIGMKSGVSLTTNNFRAVVKRRGQAMVRRREETVCRTSTHVCPGCIYTVNAYVKGV